MAQFFYYLLLYLFVTCVGIGSVQLGVPSICNKGETLSKRPPVNTNTTGKLALAGKRKQARQILDQEQRERGKHRTSHSGLL